MEHFISFFYIFTYSFIKLSHSHHKHSYHYSLHLVISVIESGKEEWDKGGRGGLKSNILLVLGHMVQILIPKKRVLGLIPCKGSEIGFSIL